MGIAVWLVPPAPEAELLKKLMRLPASVERVSYPLPCFEPHITIASYPLSVSPEILRSSLENATVPSIHVALTALSVGDAFFRSVLLDVASTPALHALHDQVQKVIPEYKARSPRFPHLSLFYIPDEHATDREMIREALWNVFGSHSEGESVTGRIAFDLEDNNGHRRRLENFDASEVWIVRCDGPVDEWTVLERINLVWGQSG